METLDILYEEMERRLANLPLPSGQAEFVSLKSLTQEVADTSLRLKMADMTHAIHKVCPGLVQLRRAEQDGVTGFAAEELWVDVRLADFFAGQGFLPGRKPVETPLSPALSASSEGRLLGGEFRGNTQSWLERGRRLRAQRDVQTGAIGPGDR